MVMNPEAEDDDNYSGFRSWVKRWRQRKQYNVLQTRTERRLDNQRTKNLISFFIFGLINNFGYVIFLSAAPDLIHDSKSDASTGTVLLADIIPSLVVKCTAAYWMHLIPYRLRIWLCSLFAVMSFHAVTYGSHLWSKLLGVVMASVSCGFGEVTFLALSSFYHRNSVSAWSSGTGGAGIFGSLFYLLLTSVDSLSPKETFMFLSLFPLVTIITFHTLFDTRPFTLHEREVIDPPEVEEGEDKNISPKVSSPREASQLSGNNGAGVDGALPADLTFSDRVKLVATLLVPYMLPLFLVYFSEYLINQGVAPTVSFPGAGIAVRDQYKWWQFLYQTGVFISRSSVNLFHVKRVMIPSVLQAINLIMLVLHVKFVSFIPNLFFALVVAFWEGLLGGLVYVSVFYNISQDVDPGHREFSMGLVSAADTAGITCAGLAALFVEPALRG